jgi:hypothetical protein
MFPRTGGDSDYSLGLFRVAVGWAATVCLRLDSPHGVQIPKMKRSRQQLE